MKLRNYPKQKNFCTWVKLCNVEFVKWGEHIIYPFSDIWSLKVFDPKRAEPKCGYKYPKTQLPQELHSEQNQIKECQILSF